MDAWLAQTWPLVHPALAAAALAAGLIPILVHIINRRRYVRVPWAAMTFLLAANRRSVRRMRMEQWLLLSARVLLMMLFGLAVARPYIPAGSVLPLPSRAHRLLLVDNSLSMSAQLGEGKTRFDEALLLAERLLDSFPPADAVSIVTMAFPAEAVVGQPVFDRRFVRDRLMGIRPTQRGTDVEGAMEVSVQIPGAPELPPGNQIVYVVSDFPRETWESAVPGQPSPALMALNVLAGRLTDPGTTLHLVPVRPAELPNVGIVRLAVDSPLLGVDWPVPIVAEVRNFGTAAVRNLQLQLRREGQIVRREPLPRLDPGAGTSVVMSAQFDQPGTHLIEARLAGTTGDVLREDDARYLSLQVRRTIPVLLVDGRPGTTELSGQAGFLAAALSPGAVRGDSSIFQARIVTEADLATAAWDELSIVALCNVSRLAPEVWVQLAAFVERGGGLLVFGGDLINVEHYNRFGFADGHGVLPVRLHPVQERPEDSPPELHFQADALVHPLVAEFAGEADSGLFSARVERYLPVEVPAGRGEVVLRYTNDAPALVAGSYGRGRVVVCTTTANMDWTNLPGRGDYVSLMLNTVAYLVPRDRARRNVLVGERVFEPLTAAQSSLPMRVGSAETGIMEPSLVPDGDGLAVSLGPIERAGAVLLSIGAETRVFAGNVDPEESFVATWDPPALARAVGPSARVVADPAGLVEQPASGRSTELAAVGLFLVMVLLLAETWMAMRFGSGAARALPARRSGSLASASRVAA